MIEKFLWGRHPDYSDGKWIKLYRNASKKERAARKAQGYELAELLFGEYPDGARDQEGEIRIYVACLAAYNNGILHGRWIDACQDEEDIRNEIRTMLEASPIDDAEEYAIHDYEGFEGAPIEEYEGIGEVAEKATFIEEHGALGAKLIEHTGNLSDAQEAMNDHYAGQYTSVAEFAEELTEQTTEIPENLRFYIDFDLMARDLEINDVFSIETGFEEVHIFWNH